MRAAVCWEFGRPLSIEDIRLSDPMANQVEVAVEACAICHSDIHYADGSWGGSLPAIFGHEAAGTVSRVGPGVLGCSPGDKVLVTLLRSCGHCPNCSVGKLAQCESPRSDDETPFTLHDGSPVLHGLGTGAFAERTIVHESQIAVIPKSMPSDVACLLSCGVITGVGGAVNTGRIPPGATVVVIGAGGVGLNAIQGAKICGASRIIAVDITEDKLADALEFGATDGILATSEKPHRQIRKLLGGRGADFALVTVGAIQAFQQAMRYLGQGGKLVIIGMPPSDAMLEIGPMEVAFKSHSLLGSSMGDANLPRDIPWLLDLYRQGRLKLDELITGRYPLERINDAIQNTVEGKARRNVIIF